MAQTDFPLPGYEAVLRSKKLEVWDHVGPAAYVTGGEAFSALNLNWGGFDFVDSMLSESGTYFIRAIPNGNPKGQAAQNVQLVWFVSATGAQVGAGTDLSAETVRLFAVGV
jgi:hypothetical protein